MPFTLPELRQLQLGGTADNLALLGIVAGAALTNPALNLPYTPAAALGALAALGGGAWIGRRVGAQLKLDAQEGTALRINSSPPPKAGEDAIHLGYIVDTGEPLRIPMSEWTRHAMIVGQSGVGKTVMGSWIMAQQIQRGGALMWVDGKLDPDNIDMLWRMCAWAGRTDDLRIISPDEPERSNTYNPILYGDAYEVASRCMALIPSAENNPGADYYRQEANQALMTILEAIHARRLAYSFADVSVLLSNDRAMMDLLANLPAGSAARTELAMFIYRLRNPMARGQVVIDTKKLRDTFAGIAGRFHSFGTGRFGQVLNSYSPEVKLYDDLLANRIIYLALPTMGKSEQASQFGKLAIGDLRSAIANIQKLPKHKRPWPPVWGFFDEAGSYVTPNWARIFEQARSANICLTPAFQTRANLEQISDELLAMTTGNTLTKMFFKPGEPNTAEWMADMIGEEFRNQYSVNVSVGTSAARESHLSKKPAGWNESGGVGFSESQVLTHRITPTELMQLGKGEAIITFDGSNIYHVRVPLAEFDAHLGPARAGQINHLRTPRAQGLALMDRIDDLTRPEPESDDDRRGERRR